MVWDMIVIHGLHPTHTANIGEDHIPTDTFCLYVDTAVGR